MVTQVTQDLKKDLSVMNLKLNDLQGSVDAKPGDVITLQIK